MTTLENETSTSMKLAEFVKFFSNPEVWPVLIFVLSIILVNLLVAVFCK